MQPTLESEESEINGLVAKLQLQFAATAAAGAFMHEMGSYEEVRARDNGLRTPSTISMDDQGERDLHFFNTAVMVPKQNEKKGDEEPEAVRSPKRASLPGSPGERVAHHEPASVDSNGPKADVLFVDDADLFPFHAAVRECQGQVDEFDELIHVLVGDKDDPSAKMRMQLLSGATASEESICAAEYAYCLGHKEVGDLLASRTLPKVSNATKATSVELLEADDEFVYISIVEGCDGDVDECELMCEAVEDDGHVIDARIKEVVRETCVDVKWTAVEYAAHLGYVEIVMKLLKEWPQNLPGKTKMQLIKQAKNSARELSI